MEIEVGRQLKFPVWFGVEEGRNIRGEGRMESDMNGINLRGEREREREGGDDPLDKKLGGTINVVNRLYLVRKYRYWKRFLLFEDRLHRLIVHIDTLVGETSWRILFCLRWNEFRVRWIYTIFHNSKLILLRKQLNIFNNRILYLYLYIFLQANHQISVEDDDKNISTIFHFSISPTGKNNLKIPYRQTNNNDSAQDENLAVPIIISSIAIIWSCPSGPVCERTWSETVWISIPVSFFQPLRYASSGNLRGARGNDTRPSNRYDS